MGRGGTVQPLPEEAPSMFLLVKPRLPLLPALASWHSSDQKVKERSHGPSQEWPAASQAGGGGGRGPSIPEALPLL